MVTLDLTGKRFGKLIAMRQTGERTANKRLLWECVCDCGATCKTTTSRLNNGDSKSCGCLAGRPAAGKVTKERVALKAYRLRSLLAYDEATGIFTRREDGPGVKAGDRAGWVGKHGHIYMDLDGFRYAAHRLAWLYVHGIWPTQDIDHINGDSGFNAISNLRDVSKSMNMQNQRRAKATSKTGILGVTLDVARSKFYASIEVDGKKKSLGRHITIEAAAEAYLKAKRALHEGCTI